MISPYSGRAPWVEGNDHHFREEALGGYPSVVRVVDVKETTHSINKASKWIVQKLDLSVAMAEAEKRQQIQVLTAKISKARKEAEERVKLEQLRELSPELSSLLDQLDALQAG